MLQLIRGHEAERTSVKNSSSALDPFAPHCFGLDINLEIIQTFLGFA